MKVSRTTRGASGPRCEQCWILLGKRRGGSWRLRKVRQTCGTRSSVAFDPQWVLRREEQSGDVCGFFHTHPDGPDRPSRRDDRTMAAWASALGKPLICVIANPAAVTAWLYLDDEQPPRQIEIEGLPRGGMICRQIVGLFPSR